METFRNTSKCMLHMVSFDCEKAYESVVMKALHFSLDSWGVWGKFRNSTDKLLQVQCKVKGEGGGPPTGAPESPVLSVMFFAWLWKGG